MSQPQPSPHVSVAMARLYLPPAPCRRCILLFRALFHREATERGSTRRALSLEDYRCKRCGIHWPTKLVGADLRPWAEDPAPWSER